MRQLADVKGDTVIIFQSTHSITECDDWANPSVYRVVQISIHALHYRVRRPLLLQIGQSSLHFNPRTPLQSATIFTLLIQVTRFHFNPRTPLQSATPAPLASAQGAGHFNPRTPLQSATLKQPPPGGHRIISIHALHYRVRRTGTQRGYASRRISIHALHYRVRHLVFTRFGGCGLFQSTHSITECDETYTPSIIFGWTFQSTHSITECDMPPV